MVVKIGRHPAPNSSTRTYL